MGTAAVNKLSFVMPITLNGVPRKAVMPRSAHRREVIAEAFRLAVVGMTGREPRSIKSISVSACPRHFQLATGGPDEPGAARMARRFVMLRPAAFPAPVYYRVVAPNLAVVRR